MRKLSMIMVIVAVASFQKPVMAQEAAASAGFTGAEIAALVIVGAAAAAVAWYALGEAGQAKL